MEIEVEILHASLASFCGWLCILMASLIEDALFTNMIQSLFSMERLNKDKYTSILPTLTKGMKVEKNIGTDRRDTTSRVVFKNMITKITD